MTCGSRECRCLGGLGYPRILGSVEALRGVGDIGV